MYQHTFAIQLSFYNFQFCVLRFFMEFSGKSLIVDQLCHRSSLVIQERSTFICAQLVPNLCYQNAFKYGRNVFVQFGLQKKKKRQKDERGPIFANKFCKMFKMNKVIESLAQWTLPIFSQELAESKFLADLGDITSLNLL